MRANLNPNSDENSDISKKLDVLWRGLMKPVFSCRGKANTLSEHVCTFIQIWICFDM